MAEYSADLTRCLEVLREGGLILYPTDTIWGIGCDACNAEAVAKVYALKQREESKSLIVLMGGQMMVSAYVDEVPTVAWDMLDCADKPLTLILDGARNLAPNLVAADGSIALRIPNDDFCEELVRRYRRPLVSTSANISGHPAPKTFADVDQAIIKGVDHVVLYRQDEARPAKPSSIVRLRKDLRVEIIRP